MNTIKKLLFLFLPIIGFSQDNTQPVKRYSYKDGVPSIEFWYGTDKILDSTKTFYKNGNKNEIIYYNEKGLKHGYAVQFDDQGEKLVSWFFDNGKLISRNDHKLPFNKNSEEIAKKALEKLTELHAKSNFNPRKVGEFYQRALLRHNLGNVFLALKDYKIVEKIMAKMVTSSEKKLSDSTKVKFDKSNSKLFDAMANIYGALEMENIAMHYFCKAIKLAPKDNRILYNFANFLQHKKSNDLAFVYLNKVINSMPNHSFAHLAMAKLYSDLGEFEKALPHIIIAAEREQNIIKRSSGYGGRDVMTTRGLIYHKLGESEKGVFDLKAALDMDKNNCFAMKNLGIIYLEKKKYAEACELFQKAKELQYVKIYDQNDLEELLIKACNQITTTETVENIKKPITTELKSDILIASKTEDNTETVLTKSPKRYIFPNPVQNIINISNLSSKSAEYELYDYLSRLVQKGKCVESTIEIDRLISGFYILKIIDNQTPYSFKIIKE